MVFLQVYTADLLCLDFCCMQNAHIPQELAQVSTPLIPEAWQVPTQIKHKVMACH